jgi:predicted ATPase
MFPPWEEIFTADGIRPSFKTSLATYADLRSAYTGSGYTLIEVPKCSVKARVSFILSYVLS